MSAIYITMKIRYCIYKLCWDLCGAKIFLNCQFTKYILARFLLRNLRKSTKKFLVNSLINDILLPFYSQTLSYLRINSVEIHKGDYWQFSWYMPAPTPPAAPPPSPTISHQSYYPPPSYISEVILVTVCTVNKLCSFSFLWSIKWAFDQIVS